jgi:hypothetical protein
MDYGSSLVDFLSKKENITYALEIADRIEKVKDKLLRDFWRGFKDKIGISLGEHELINKWALKFDEAILNNITKDWEGIFIKPSIDQEQFVNFYVCQENQRLYVGMGWHKITPQNYVLDEVISLQNKLNKEGYDTKIYPNENINLGWRWTDYYIRRNDFLTRIATDNIIIIDEIADIYWAMIMDNIAYVGKANSAIKEAIQNGEQYP